MQWLSFGRVKTRQRLTNKRRCDVITVFMHKKRLSISRFLERIQINVAHTYQGSPCWDWQGARRSAGYGYFRAEGRNGKGVSSSHEFAHEFFIGSIPEGYEVDHLCERECCCNPLHLEAVTVQENRRRRGARITHCKHGHEFTLENVYVMPNGGRQCRECNRRRVREFYGRNAGYYNKYRKATTS